MSEYIGKVQKKFQLFNFSPKFIMLTVFFSI
jgi:hypothetical protein